MKWVRVNRRHRCPICDHDTWCSVNEPGTTAVCMRVVSDEPCKSGGYFHPLGEVDPSTRNWLRTAPKCARKADTASMADLANLYESQATSLQPLSDQLGVSVRALERLNTGYNDHTWTFPMRNDQEEICGIRIRSHNGKKWCVTGSREGLFWPLGVALVDKEPLVLPEGPSDTATLLDLGFCAIGRPACDHGFDLIASILKKYRRHVVILADRDETKTRPDGTSYRPGIDGARKLATRIRPLCRSLKIVLPPCKDVRAWKPTRLQVEQLISRGVFL